MEMDWDWIHIDEVPDNIEVLFYLPKVVSRPIIVHGKKFNDVYYDMIGDNIVDEYACIPTSFIHFDLPQKKG